MIAIDHFWTDNQLELAFSFSRFPCRIQNGTDEFVVNFTPRTLEEALIIREQMVKTIHELDKLTGGNNGMAT
mgnify:CR=1 FL=1|jgi:hypothetical protein